MKVETSIKGEQGYIRLDGDLDSEQSGQVLQSAVADVLERGKKTVVVDLTGVQNINSCGLGNMLKCQELLRAHDGKMLVKPLQGFVKEVFDILMLDALFTIEH